MASLSSKTTCKNFNEHVSKLVNLSLDFLVVLQYTYLLHEHSFAL